MLLISARRLVMLYISTKFCEIISNGIKVIQRTRCIASLGTVTKHYATKRTKLENLTDIYAANLPIIML